MTVQAWLGLPVADLSGRRYGRLDDLFVGRHSGTPEFGIVSLDPEGDYRVAVPLHTAHRDGDALVLPLDLERVMSAPRVQGEVEEIPVESGRRVLEFFGLEPDAGAAPTETMPAADSPVAGEEDTEVILSEEQLRVDTVARPTERVRVRKAVVTEEVTVTVTVRREELIIDREPIAGEAVEGAVLDAPLAAGGELEIVLHAEEPVVTKRVVPVERIRLHRNTITEQQRITDTVRKERAEIDELPIPEQEQTP